MVIETLSHQTAINKCKELAALVAQHTDGQRNGVHATAIDSLFFTRACAPSAAIPGVSEPLLAIVVQGKKEMLLNEEIYRYGIAQYLVVSVDLPLSVCGRGDSRSALSRIEAESRPSPTL